MTSDPQPQSRETQGPQPETKTAQGSETKDRKTQSWFKRLGVALGDFLLGDLKDQIEIKLDEKLDKKIDNIIKLQKIEESARKDMNDKVSETVEKVKKYLQEEIVRELKKNYEELNKKYEEFKNKYETLEGKFLKVNIAIGILILLPTILLTTGNSIISDILSLDVLKSDIETLKEDLEDLRDN